MEPTSLLSPLGCCRGLGLCRELQIRGCLPIPLPGFLHVYSCAVGTGPSPSYLFIILGKLRCKCKHKAFCEVVNSFHQRTTHLVQGNGFALERRVKVGECLPSICLKGGEIPRMECVSAWLETVEFYSFCLMDSMSVENYFHSGQAPSGFQLQPRSQLHTGEINRPKCPDLLSWRETLGAELICSYRC